MKPNALSRRTTLLCGLLTSIVLMLLIGCANTGQDQNYRLLEEDRPMFETRPNPDKPGASAIPLHSQTDALASLFDLHTNGSTTL